MKIRAMLITWDNAHYMGNVAHSIRQWHIGEGEAWEEVAILNKFDSLMFVLISFRVCNAEVFLFTEIWYKGSP